MSLDQLRIVLQCALERRDGLGLSLQLGVKYPQEKVGARVVVLESKHVSKRRDGWVWLPRAA